MLPHVSHWEASSPDLLCEQAEEVLDVVLGDTVAASLVVTDQLTNQSSLHQEGPGLRGESQRLKECDAVANSSRCTAVAVLLLRPLRVL